MDTRSDLINKIMLSVNDSLNEDQKRKLNDILYIQLDKYNVAESSTELCVSDNSPIQLLKQFIICKEIEGRSKGTLKLYYDINRNLLEELDKPINEITTYDIRMYLYRYKACRENCSNTTLDNMRRIFSSFFTWLYDNNIISTNPLKGVAVIKTDKLVKKPYSDIELEKIKLAAKSDRDKALVEFLYSTGCRVSEVVALNRRDVNFLDRSIVVMGKGKKQRVVYLSDVALFYLQIYLSERRDNNECLFVADKAPYNRLQKSGIEAALKRIEKISLVENVHPHRFRRTLATNLLNRGADIQDISKLLGHRDIATTQIYCYLNQENVKNTYNKLI